MKTACFLAAALLASLTAPAHAASGDAETAYAPSVNQYVRGLAVQPDGSLLLSGDFTSLGGQTRNYLGRLNAAGSLDAGFNPNADGNVRTVVVLSSGQLLIGGFFFNVDGHAQRGLARLNANGSIDTTFVTPVFPGQIYGIAPLSDGRIVIAGQGTPNPPAVPGYLARLTTNGSIDAGFTATADGVVYSMAMQADGKFVIGGPFTHVNGQVRNYIARLNADGTLDPGFNPNASSTVYCVAVQPDGRVLLGGGFSTVGGVSQPIVARVNADGTLDANFAHVFSSGVAYTVVLQTDGKVLVGGTFNFPGPRIVRLTASIGAVDATFNASNANDEVYGFAGQADGRELVGGKFGSIGGKTRLFLARLLNDAATQSLTVPSAVRVQWLRGGASPEASSVTFEVSTDGGGTWTTLGAGVRIAGGWELSGLSLSGIGQVRARARTPSGYFSNSSGLLEAVQTYSFLTALQQWKLTHLGDANAPNDGDPDFDGLGNILEYATGADPLVPSALPAVSTIASTTALTFPRNTTATDVTLTVQGSDDLSAWTDLARSTGGATMVALVAGVTVSESGAGALRTVEVRDLYTIDDPAHPQRFLRLQAAPTAAAPAAPLVQAPAVRHSRPRRGK